MTNVLTVDVEDWYHDSDGLSEASLGSREREARVERNLEVLLDLFEEAGARATLFVLGEVAEQHPEVVRRAAREGHEIASHGYRHRPVRTLLRREFAEDVRRAKAVLEDVTGGSVLGYRAPYFSLTADVWWPADALRAAGFRYDSSVLPIDRPPGLELVSPRLPYRVRHGLWEVPIAICHYYFWHLPFLGGFFLRVLPLSFLRRRLDEFNESVGPAVLHVHPWELDREGPEGAKLSPAIRGLKRVGRGAFPRKLRTFLGGGSFGTIRDVFPQVAVELPGNR